MKKLIAMLLVLCLCATMFAGCSVRVGNERPVSGTKPAQNEGTEAPRKDKDQGKNKPAETNPPETNPSKTGDVSVEETVLYEANGVRITLKSLDTDGFMGPEFKLLVENDTDQNIMLTDNGLVVNGVTLSGGMYISVAAGKKANDTLEIYNDALETAGIEQIATVMCDAYIFDSDTYETMDEFRFTINTSIADTYVQEIDEHGDVILDQDGITVIAKSLSDSLFGNKVVMLVKNDTGKDIRMSADNVSVNGFMVSAWMYDTVYAGTVCFCELEISGSDLEDNDIEQIDEITFTLEAFDIESYRTITASGEIGLYVTR